MKRKAVNSTDIESIGYDKMAKTLEVAFHSGGLYQYLLVPSQVHAALMTATSHGTYFHAHIKDKYNCRKLR